MNKVYDLRFVIGLFFLLIGAILTVYYFTATPKAEVNIWCGLLFMIFGGGMIALSAVNKEEEE
jgi:uncharacterized membrane protein HdeD (DUF308 family)